MSTSEWVNFGTAGGLLAASLIGLWRGWFYPGALVRAWLAERDKRLEDKDAIILDLKAAVAAAERRSDLLGDQVFRMVEATQTSNAIIRALPAAARDAA